MPVNNAYNFLLNYLHIKLLNIEFSLLTTYLHPFYLCYSVLSTLLTHCL